MPAQVRTHRHELVLWDVVEEHLDEAEFGIEQLERMLDHPLLTLKDIARYPQERLLAHIDGLVVGGAPVIEELLLPQLAAADPAQPARTTAVALALIHAGRCDLVTSALSHDEPGVRAAIVRACELALGSDVERWALAQIQVARSSRERAALLEIGAARSLPIEPAIEWLQSPDSDLVVAAVHAARTADPNVYRTVMESLLDHAERTVREAALVVGLAWGSRSAWAACERWAVDDAQPQPLAMALYAALGGPAHHVRLAQQLGSDTQRPLALFALGFTGNVAQLPALLEYARSPNPREAKLAAQAIATIAGLDLADDAYAMPAPRSHEGPALPPATEDAEAQSSLPPLEEDDLEADIVPAPEDGLPVPNAASIARFWEEHRPEFDAATRYLGGVAWTPHVALDYLEHAPLRRRHLIACAFGVRAGGNAWLSTRAFPDAQRAHLAAMRGLHLRFAQPLYSSW